MTRIQRGWAVAAVLAGALFACTIALIACALFVTAARQARRP